MRYEQGSCVVCGQGTDTALGTEGEAEWHQAFLINLGIPEEQAVATVSAWSKLPPGLVPVGRYSVAHRVCAACVSRAKCWFPPPVLVTRDAVLPTVQQP